MGYRLPATTDEWFASFSFFGNPVLENVNLQVFTCSPKVSTLDLFVVLSVTFRGAAATIKRFLFFPYYGFVPIH